MKKEEMMRKLFFVVAVLSAFAITSCGGEDDGGNGGGTVQDAINKSIAAFQAIESDVEDNFGDVCVLKALYDCNAACQIGSLEYDDVQDKAILNSCEHTDGSTFTGTVQYNDAQDSMYLDMSLFGDCTFVKGTITGVETDNCQGTVTGTCAGEDITCEVDSSCDTCVVTSDGGGGGGTTGAAALNAALGEYLMNIAAGDHILNAPNDCSGTAPDWYDCPCPSSGTLDWDLNTNEIEYYSCTGSAGLVYDGSVDQSSLNTDPFVFDFILMDQFGLCTDVTGSVSLDATSVTPLCTAGSLSGTCPAEAGVGTETVSCTVSSDCTCS
jgi:hypothetical protein